MGTLRLGNAKFLHGCIGINLDYLARQAFWERGLDFNHGTGHGVAPSQSNPADLPAPPKGEPLAIHATFIFLPRPLPLGEVDLRSKDGEGEPAKIIMPNAAQRLRGFVLSLIISPSPVFRNAYSRWLRR